MKKQKRTGLDAIALPDNADDDAAQDRKTAKGSAEANTQQPGGAAKKYKHTSLYLPDGAREQLRELAFYERVKQHELILEAVDMLFRARGRKSIKELEEAAE
jgi:hypothetical protein